MFTPSRCSRGRVFVIGYPGDVGGANTECWHTVRLWRRRGWDVTLVPTWRPDAAWKARLEKIGCTTARANPDSLAAVPGLAGGVVVSFCNSHFLRAAARFRQLRCRVIWVNCMTWLFAEERRHYRAQGPSDAYIFQSRYQRDTLGPQLASHGVRPEQHYLIRGAFWCDEYPLDPLWHELGTPLVVGRISRADSDKYASSLWGAYGRIPHPIRARVMAWNRRIERKVGTPPDWAECLPAGARTPRAFLGSLHCLVPLNGGAAENWPRAGLEAMAAGVPIVAENRWGWREMIRHGKTGYLAKDEDELAYYVARPAHDEPHRQEMIHRARNVLQEELANMEEIGDAWDRLFKAMM